MTLKDAILLNVSEPKNCFKSEVILYKNNRGRINFHQKTGEISDFSIISYYIVINDNDIEIHDEKGLIKLIDKPLGSAKAPNNFAKISWF